MKKLYLLAMFIITFSYGAHSQQLTIAVSPFEIRNSFTQDEADIITDLFIAELVKKGGARIVDRNNFNKIMTEMRFQMSDWSDAQKVARLGAALNANSIITGQLMKMGNQFFITANLLDINTAQIISSSRIQLNSIDEVFNKIPGLVNEIAQNFPKPNLIIGRWVAEYEGSAPDGYRKPPKCICIFDFKPDGTIIIERYDTIEMKMYLSASGNRLNDWTYSIMNGHGSGRYSYEYTNDNRITISVSLKLNNVYSDISTINHYFYMELSNNRVISLNYSSSTPLADSLPCGNYFIYQGSRLLKTENTWIKYFSLLKN